MASWDLRKPGGGGGGGSEATTVADTASIDLTLAGTQITGVVLPAGVDHNGLANLTVGDPHTQYALDSDLAAHVIAADPHPGYLLESAVSAFGLSLIDDANAGAARTTLGLGTAAVKDTGTAADRVLLTDANADVTFAEPTWTAGALVGGNLLNATSTRITNTYTATANPSDFAGTALLVQWNPTLNYAGDALVGPRSTTPFYGPRGVIQIEGKVTYNFDQDTFGANDIAFSDQLLIKNNAANNRNIRAKLGFQACKVYQADNADNVIIPGDFAPGPIGFVASQVFLANEVGATWTVPAAYGFYDGPFFGTGTTTTKRVAYGVRDSNDYAANDIPSVVATAYGIANVLTGYTNPVTQIGLEVPRMVNATNNYGVKSDTPLRLYSDTATITAASLGIIHIPGTITSDFASARFPTAVDVSATFKYKQAGLGGTGSSMLLNAMVLRNDTTFTGALGVALTLSDFPTFIGDTNATTMTAARAVHSSPTLDVANAGTLTVTNVEAVRSGLTVTAGTVTNRTPFVVVDASGAGTVVNQVGLDIPSLAKGTTLNLGIRNASRTVFTPSTQALTAVGNTISPTATTHCITSTGSLVMTSAPTIPDGVDGQILMLVNVDTADTVTIQDQGTLASSNLRLVGVSAALAPRESITLMYSATIGDWVELHRSGNVT